MEVMDFFTREIAGNNNKSMEPRNMLVLKHHMRPTVFSAARIQA